MLTPSNKATFSQTVRRLQVANNSATYAVCIRSRVDAGRILVIIQPTCSVAGGGVRSNPSNPPLPTGLT